MSSGNQYSKESSENDADTFKLYYVKNRFNVQDEVTKINQTLKTVEVLITSSDELMKEMTTGIFLYFDGPRDIIHMRCKYEFDVNYRNHDILPLYAFLVSCLCDNFYEPEEILKMSKKIILKIFDLCQNFSLAEKKEFFKEILKITRQFDMLNE